MLISVALIIGVAFGDIPVTGLYALLITWIPDISIAAILKGTIN